MFNCRKHQSGCGIAYCSTLRFKARKYPRKESGCDTTGGTGTWRDGRRKRVQEAVEWCAQNEENHKTMHCARATSKGKTRAIVTMRRKYLIQNHPRRRRTHWNLHDSIQCPKAGAVWQQRKAEALLPLPPTTERSRYLTGKYSTVRCRNHCRAEMILAQLGHTTYAVAAAAGERHAAE